jgi:O-antigen/teichoic acid export membrane protein
LSGFGRLEVCVYDAPVSTEVPPPGSAAQVQEPAPAPLSLGRRRIVGDIGIQIVARAGNLMLGVVVTLIVVRGLGVRGFGEWSTLLAIGQITSSLGDLGLGQVAVSRAASDPGAEPQWLGALLGMRLLLSVPIFVLQLAAMLAIAPNRRVAIAGVLMASMAIVGASSALSAAFQVRVRNDLTMLLLTVNSVVWTGGAAIVAAFTSDIRAFAAVFLVSNLISTALTVVLVLRTTPIRLAGVRAYWRPMLRVGAVLGAAGIIVTAYVRLDQVLVLTFAGSRQAGLYAAAYRILDQAQFVPGSVMATLFPLIAAAYPANLARVRRLLQTSADYLSMGSLGAVAFTIVAAKPIMVLLFGTSFAPAASALPVLMGAFVSISFGYLVGNMVVILGLQHRYLAFAIVGLIVNVILNVALIPPYGFRAAAWVTLVTEFTVMSLSMRSVLKRLEMRPEWDRIGRVAIAAAAMGGAVALGQSGGLPLGVLVALGAALYIGLLFALGALRPSDVSGFLRREPIA